MELEGEWCKEPRKVKQEIREFFRKHFQKKQRGRLRFPTHLVEAHLDDGDGDILTRRFDVEEVKRGIWECEDSKSPGPDGFNFCFFKSCWNIIKNDLMRVLEEFHSNGKLSGGCNTSFIVLIPKKKEIMG